MLRDKLNKKYVNLLNLFLLNLTRNMSRKLLSTPERTKMDFKEWKDTLCFWINDVVMMSVFPNL